MRRIAPLLLALLAVGAPAQAGLMEILESTTQPKVPQRLQPKLPPMPLTQSRGKNWVGTTHPKADLPILVMAGHADSQRMTGSGTPGRAVDVGGGNADAGWHHR